MGTWDIVVLRELRDLALLCPAATQPEDYELVVNDLKISMAGCTTEDEDEEYGDHYIYELFDVVEGARKRLVDARRDRVREQ